MVVTEKEERVWRYILENRKATVEQVADACGVGAEFVENMISRISSVNWREDVKPKAPRCELLDEASKLTAGDRNETYGEPVENMQHTADIFNAWNKDGITLTARHITMVHQATKMARRTITPDHRDSYVDNMAYTGIEYECVAGGE
jgi:hypothetical protein